ncbi:DUF862 domain-containing protein [Meloidogyne graminicola]|uniref:DUF862 domain-containing protein n=1 Tax=Meloidogyne graminicola TaxID=189291 RepID=A0A8S9ZJ68_9BILA|nr:DUF862 domain-containing protein [Meloidogyne graminicola]
MEQNLKINIENNQVKLAVYNFEKRLRIFHIGILVGDNEFHFGIKQGIYVCPKRNNGKKFSVLINNIIPREMAFLRYVNIYLNNILLTTSLSFDQLLKIKYSLEKYRFGPNTYNIFYNNCIDFAYIFLCCITTTNKELLNKNKLPIEIKQPWITEPFRLLNKHLFKYLK